MRKDIVKWNGAAVRIATLLLLAGLLHCSGRIDDKNLKDSEILVFQPAVSPPEIYRYKAFYRGSLPVSNNMNFIYGINGKGTARFHIQYIGAPDDRVSLRAADKGSRTAECTVENVPGRIGCIIKAESEGRLFILSIERTNTGETVPVELYIFAESEEQKIFYRSRDDFL